MSVKRGRRKTEREKKERKKKDRKEEERLKGGKSSAFFLLQLRVKVTFIGLHGFSKRALKKTDGEWKQGKKETQKERGEGGGRDVMEKRERRERSCGEKL